MKMKLLAVFATGSLIFGIGTVQPTFATTITFSTGDFVTSEWSSHIHSSSTGTSTATTATSGGNPNAYRNVSLTVDPYEWVLNSQLWNIATFTPAVTGTVESVALSYDISRVFTSNAGATQVAKGISIQQDGNIYRYYGGVTTVSSPNWESFSVADLVPLFPSVNWINGSEIIFGFYDSVGTGQQGFTIAGGYDNFTVTIDYTSAAPVPEPATMLLMGMGLAGLVGVRRKKKW